MKTMILLPASVVLATTLTTTALGLTMTYVVTPPGTIQATCISGFVAQPSQLDPTKAVEYQCTSVIPVCAAGTYVEQNAAWSPPTNIGYFNGRFVYKCHKY